MLLKKQSSLLGIFCTVTFLKNFVSSGSSFSVVVNVWLCRAVRASFSAVNAVSHLLLVELHVDEVLNFPVSIFAILDNSFNEIS